MPLSTQEFLKLQQEAKNVLANNHTGEFTKPTSNLYPHQWSWDSCFIAIGYAHYDQQKAEAELKRLFNAQWKSGMIPHIVFDKKELKGEYFPEPEFWQTECSADASTNYLTSGICQPPVHAIAVRHIIEHAKDKDRALRFAKQAFPFLERWHRYLYEERDPDEENLVYIRHPWESGQDNSPVWDPVLEHIDPEKVTVPPYERQDLSHIDAAERPEDLDYDRYVYLVDLFRRCRYSEQAIRDEGCPFLVQDVLFNTILVQANANLAQIAEYIGENPEVWKIKAGKTQKAMNSKLWDDKKGLYVNYDLDGGRPVHEKVLSGFLPVYAGIPDQKRAQRLFDYLNTHCFCRLDDSCFAAPTFDRSSPQFSSSKYWRGPVWINLNWMLCLGLSRYGFEDYAKRIMDSIIRLPAMSGFYEYFDPDTGQGYGTENFSWTAALLLDVMYQRGLANQSN